MDDNQSPPERGGNVLVSAVLAIAIFYSFLFVLIKIAERLYS